MTPQEEGTSSQVPTSLRGAIFHLMPYRQQPNEVGVNGGGKNDQRTFAKRLVKKSEKGVNGFYILIFENWQRVPPPANGGNPRCFIFETFGHISCRHPEDVHCTVKIIKYITKVALQSKNQCSYQL